MTTFTIHPVNSDQETAIRIFLDALHVDYKTLEETDETAYLMSSSEMVKHINSAIEQEQRGEGTKVNLDDIWK